MQVLLDEAGSVQSGHRPSCYAVVSSVQEQSACRFRRDRAYNARNRSHKGGFLANERVERRLTAILAADAPACQRHEPLRLAVEQIAYLMPRAVRYTPRSSRASTRSEKFNSGVNQSTTAWSALAASP